MGAGSRSKTCWGASQPRQPQPQPQPESVSPPPFHRKDGTETYTGQPAVEPEKAGVSGKAGRVVIPLSPQPQPQLQRQPQLQPQEEPQELLQHIEIYPHFRCRRVEYPHMNSICPRAGWVG